MIWARYQQRAFFSLTARMGLWKILLGAGATKDTHVVNIGILGAAQIAPLACINPLRHLPNGVAYAVAARDRYVLLFFI